MAHWTWVFKLLSLNRVFFLFSFYRPLKPNTVPHNLLHSSLLFANSSRPSISSISSIVRFTHHKSHFWLRTSDLGSEGFLLRQITPVFNFFLQYYFLVVINTYCGYLCQHSNEESSRRTTPLGNGVGMVTLPSLGVENDTAIALLAPGNLSSKEREKDLT